VTRDAVLGLEVVLADGRVVSTGGRTVKSFAGHEMTRVIVGSEKHPGRDHRCDAPASIPPAVDPVTFVASFPSLPGAGEAVSAIITSGLAPSLLELLDRVTANAVEDYRRLDLDGSLPPCSSARPTTPMPIGRSTRWRRAVCRPAQPWAGAAIASPGRPVTGAVALHEWVAAAWATAGRRWSGAADGLGDLRDRRRERRRPDRRSVTCRGRRRPPSATAAS
jgi:FAD/FMN-containing dehydrogenase